MKRMISGLLSLMMLGMTGTACLPAQAAESDYAETTTTALPSDVLQMSLNFSTLDWALGTPLYLDGITASVFSQKDGYLVCDEPITNSKYFKLDTFEFDHADRPGTYNVYVAYNGENAEDLYTFLRVNVYAETDVTTFGPVGTVWTETTIPADTAPLDTTFTTTADPYGDATDYPADTTFDAIGTMTTAVTTKQTYRTTLPTRETQTTTAVTTGTRFDPVGTVVTTGTTAKPQETTAEFTTNMYTNVDGVVCYEYYTRVGDTIPVDAAYTGLPYDFSAENAVYNNGIITAVNPGKFALIFFASDTLEKEVARVNVTILPAADMTETIDTTSDAAGTMTTAATTKQTYRTTLPTTGTRYTTTTAPNAPVGTVVTSTTKATEPTAMSTTTTADAAGTEIAPETTKPDTESGAPRAGDTNGDGEVNILDVIRLNRNLLCGEVLDAQAIRNADVDGDGTPTFADALMILKYTIRLITSF